MLRPVFIVLVAVEEAGDEEEHGDGEGKTRMQDCVYMELLLAVQKPYHASDKPYPGGLLHSSTVDGRPSQ